MIFLVLLLLITLLIICVNPFYKVLVPLSLLEYASLFNREPQLNTLNLVLKIEGKLAISDDCPVAIQTYIFPFLLNLLSFGNLFSKKKINISKKNNLLFFRRDAEDAMDALDGRMYDGRDLRIQMAKYGRPEQNRHSRGGRGRSRSRSRDRRRRSRSRSRRRSRSRSGRRSSPKRRDSRSSSEVKSPRRDKSRSVSQSRSKSRSKSASRSRSRSRS